MGGGTGTGATPVIAKLAKEMGCLTVAIVTTPFEFEGDERIAYAKDGIEKLRHCTDALIEVDNEKFYEVDRIWDDIYKIGTDNVRRCVQTITDITTRTGQMNRDFNDVKKVLKDAGPVIMGWGECPAESSWMEAFNKATTNEYGQNYDITKARKILIVFTTPHGIPNSKIKEVMDSIKAQGRSLANNISPNISFGQCIEERLDSNIKIAIIASGFKASTQAQTNPYIHSQDAKRETHRTSSGDKANTVHKEKKEKEKSDASQKQPQLPLTPKAEDINFDEPAYEHWTNSGRLDKRK
jgi:cell division protein FtsZ